MYSFSKKSKEKLDNKLVHPKIRQLMYEAIKYCPIDFIVIETVRTFEQQEIYVAKGVSKTLKSKHLPDTNKSGLCEAVDIAPYPIDWKNIERFNMVAAHIKRVAYLLDIPIQWGGDWKTFKDYPHYELKKTSS